MFEERGADEVLEFRPYRATGWQRVPFAETPTAPQAENTVSTGGMLQTLGGLLQPIRTFLADHEEILLIAVVLLLLCDCEDDLELLIAAAVLLLPKLGAWLH